MIISQNSNDVYYAYFRGRFWRWDESAHVWKESHLLAQKFGKAKTVEKRLTPEAFLASDEFIPMDDYELPERMLTALRDAKPCKNAPIEPVEERPIPSAQCLDAATAAEKQAAVSPAVPEESSPTTETANAAKSSDSQGNAVGENAARSAGSGRSSDKPLTFIREDKCPAFDYSGLTDQAVEDLHFAEDEYRHGKQMAERGLVHMGNAIAAAHDALCRVVALCDNSKHGNRGDDTFRAWCLSMGITKDSAYRLLQVSALMDGSNPRQRAVLESLPPTLLYAVAKPSAPQELVEQVKNGEVTTNKAYQDLLKENQQLRTDRVNAMNQADRERDRADQAEAREVEARQSAHTYHVQLEEATASRNSLLDQQSAYIADINGLKERVDAAEAREEEAWKMQSKAETRAQDLEKQLEGSRQVAEAAKLRGDKLKAENDALKKQPITAVVDEEEVDKRAGEKAYQIAADMTAELRQQLEQTTSGNEQEAHSSYDNVLLADRSFQNIGKMVVPSLRRLPPEQREQLTNMLIRTLGQIQGEVSKCL